MNTNKPQQKWVAAYASVIGNGHIKENIPCQDNCNYQVINDLWSVAVVCDGAGSARKSEIGSDFVARNVAHCLAEITQKYNWQTAAEMPTAAAWRVEAVQIMELVWQRLQQFAQAETHEIRDLACTVVAAIYSEFGALVVHIGDGRGAWRNEKGDWQALFEPFRGSEVNETVFITSDIWYPKGLDLYLATSVLIAPISALALTSDGCERGSFLVNVYDEAQQKYIDPNQPFKPFFEPNIKGLLQMYREGKTQAEINTIWQDFLLSGHKQFRMETDDKTLILAVRTNLQ